MHLVRERFDAVLRGFAELGLVQKAEGEEVLRLFGADFPYRATLDKAASIHVHMRVDDVSHMPHAQIRELGGRAENEMDGYIKYVFAGGVNMIFSSIDVAEDDRLPGPARPRPHMDHIGVDIREASGPARAAFDGVADTAVERGWRYRSQGVQGKPVYCCHVEVAEKHWVYPPQGDSSWRTPVEFAYGELKVNPGKVGCDLRPMDPAHPSAAKAGCCGAPP